MIDIKFILKSSFVSVMTLLMVLSLGAQENVTDIKTPHLKKYFKSAKRAKDHYSQIDFLEELTKRKPEKLQYKYDLARAYDNSRNFQRALEEYSKVYYADQEAYAVCLFHMGRIMKTREQYDMAKVYFEKFVKGYSDKNNGKYYKSLVKAEIAGCDFALAEDTATQFARVKHTEGYVNFANIEFSPQIIDSNTFWYISLPSDSVVFIKEDVVDETTLLKRKIYEAKKVNGEWKNNGEAEIFVNKSKNNIGSFCFSHDQQRIYYTVCKPNWQNRIMCKIYMAEKEDGEWGKPILLPGDINLSKYTSTHPAVGFSSKPDREILYFVSDRPDGKGHMDIWYTRYRISKGTFEKARNCGTKVNSIGNEMSPVYDNKAHRLYYSSDGQPGIGGYDIFYTSGERSRWTGKGVNIGKSINSPVDDMYYMLFDDRETGLLISNREGSISLKHEHCCDDIFQFKWYNSIHINLKGGIKNDSDKTPINDAQLIVFLINEEDKEEIEVDRILSKEDGTFDLELFEENKYRIVVHKEGLFNETFDVSTKGIVKTTVITKNVLMRPIPDAEIIIPNIYYDFDDAGLTPLARTAIDTSIFVLLTQNPTLIVEIASHTDSKGSNPYNLNLSQRRAESVVNYLRKQGIPKDRVKPKGYGETQPIAPNENPDGTDNPEGRARNRRTSFRVIGELPVQINYEEP